MVWFSVGPLSSMLLLESGRHNIPAHPLQGMYPQIYSLKNVKITRNTGPAASKWEIILRKALSLNITNFKQ